MKMENSKRSENRSIQMEERIPAKRRELARDKLPAIFREMLFSFSWAFSCYSLVCFLLIRSLACPLCWFACIEEYIPLASSLSACICRYAIDRVFLSICLSAW